MESRRQVGKRIIVGVTIAALLVGCGTATGGPPGPGLSAGGGADPWGAPGASSEVPDSKATETAPTDPAGARNVTFEVAREQLAIDPSAEPYRPMLPPALRRPGFGVHIRLLLRVCVPESGDGGQVAIVRGGDPLVDNEAVSRIKSWRYRPLVVDGKALPFCFPLRVDMTPENPTRYSSGLDAGSAEKVCGGRGRPHEECCTALTSAGDALAARGDRQRAYDLYEEVRTRCFTFAPVRRRLYLLRKPEAGASDPTSGYAEAWLTLEIDNQLAPDVQLGWFAPYLDGEAVQTVAPTRLQPGAHELHLEVYLARRVPAAPRDPIRLDVRHTLVLPRALVGGPAVVGGARVVIQDKGGAGALPDRVLIDITPVPFRPLQTAPSPGHSIAATPPNPSPSKRRLVMVAPNVGYNLLMTWGLSRLPESLRKKGFWTLLKVCVTEHGSVEQASFILSERGERAGTADAADEVAIISAVGRWRHEPYRLDGQPVAFCYPLRLTITP